MMIEVNLLPAELRRVERTPLPRFLVIIIGTAAVMATLAFGVVVNLRKVPDLEAKQQAVAKDIFDSTGPAAAWDKLQDEIGDAQSRKQAIAELWRTRISWSHKLAQLSQMVPSFVGFTEVRLEDARGSYSGQDTGGMFTVESMVSGADLDRVAAWRRTIEGNKPFFASFLDLLPTETNRVAMSEDKFVEKDALRVSIKMPVKPVSTRMTEAMQALQDEMNKPPPTTATPASLPATPPPAAGPAPAKSETPAATGAGATPASIEGAPAATPASSAN